MQGRALADGSRRVTSITEITGMEGDIITMQEIFVFEKWVSRRRGAWLGPVRATGVRPRCSEQLEASGIHLPGHLFEETMEVGAWE